MAIYTDIDQIFTLNSNGDINILEDVDAIRNSIRNIILTPFGQRTIYQQPLFGCGVKNLLGEKANSATRILLKEEIETALKNYEPRVAIEDVVVNMNDEYTYNVIINYRVLSINISDELQINLSVLK